MGEPGGSDGELHWSHQGLTTRPYRLRDIKVVTRSTNQGQASFYNSHHTKARPKWEDVKQYLFGNITLQELKNRLGC